MVKKGCVWVTIAGFVISMVMLAFPLAFIATISAPLHSPQIIGQVICPEGSRVEVVWENGDATGEKTANVTCVNAAGNRTPAGDLDGTNLNQAFWLYYPICLVPLLIGGGVFGVAIYVLIRRFRKQDESAIMNP